MESEVELCVEVGSNIGDTWVENADINQLCRSCANTHDNMIPIFEGDGLEHDLQNKIDKHFPVNISRDDGLPHQMCYQCASTLVAWHDMYMGCIDAENKLKNLLKKSTAKGQVEKTVAGSSIASAVSASVEPDSQQKMASEMEVDNDDNDDDDDDDVPEHGGDDNDDEEDDDDDNDDEDEEVEEIVLHKLEAKAKEKNVEVNEKGTTIRDQIMVLRKDNNQMQTFSFVLHLNGNEKTLELSTDFPESSDLEGNLNVIKEVVKHVRKRNNLIDGETLNVKVKSTRSKNTYESEGNNDVMHKMYTEAKNLKSTTTGHGYYCRDCDLRYKHKHNFEAHMKTHISANKSTDEVSEPRSNEDGQQLKTKKTIHCEKCNKYFTSKSTIRMHMRHTHYGVKKYVCEFCGKRFVLEGLMKEHRRIHLDERPFVCQVCGHAAKTSSALRSHLRLHSDARPFSCSTCQKAFKFSHQLTAHHTVHTQEKKYVCDTCGKAFTRPNVLQRHIQSHTDLRPYQCPLCTSTFSQKRYLRQHLNGRHNLDPRETNLIVQNIEKQVTKHDQDIPVNDTVDAHNLLKNEYVGIDETEEALRGLDNVENHENNLINCTD